MRYRKTLSIFLATITLVGNIEAQRLSREEYIKKYKGLAIEQQQLYGIPASITMAQALFESDNGNSRLAREANNHFGIKCKKEWAGPTIAHTDDAPNECFRKYGSIEESFIDHSVFLDNSSRYQELFKLDPFDYKGWAEGLQKAGYATDSLYAKKLITVIKDNDLHQLDLGWSPKEGDLLALSVPAEPTVIRPLAGNEINIDKYVVSVNRVQGYSLYANNGSEFIMAKQGDNFSKIGSLFLISEKKLRKFNDVSSVTTLKEGDIVYIKAKSKRTTNGKLMHYVTPGETLHSISQLYGIRLGNLAKLNRRTADMPLVLGQQIRLM